MRRAGILLHPTSLPGPYGSGDIGPTAREYLAWLESAGQRIWQMLPLHPVDGLGSPYAAPSAFAGNPMLLSVDDMVDEGWLRQVEKPYLPGSDRRFIYARVAEARAPALALAAERVASQVDLAAYRRTKNWLEDWCLYASISAEHGGDWSTWPADLRDRTPAGLARARELYAAAIDHHAALQWLFDRQWTRLRLEANNRGIALWGDLPFMVSHASADVWAHRELFQLDEAGIPTVISGVPPDAFSPEGQLWGHPQYNDDAHRASKWAWWCDRVESLLERVDAVRLDHFRGVEAAWHVEAGAPNALGGKWVKGPGAELLSAIRDRVGAVPIIAEDLGVITPEVEALRDDFELPGMAILEFAFGSDTDHAYLPHNYRKNLVVYPGTHDNDTVVGWYQSSNERTRDHARRYLNCSGSDIAWDLIRAAYRSHADTAIIAMQDALALDGSARMNVPGQAEGNWGWRMGREAMNVALAHHLRLQVSVSGRLEEPE